MSEQDKDLQERIKKLEQKAEQTEKMLQFFVKFLDEKFPKEPMQSWTDGPIMSYGKHKIDWRDLNVPSTEIKKEFKTQAWRNKKGADEPRGDEA